MWVKNTEKNGPQIPMNNLNLNWQIVELNGVLSKILVKKNILLMRTIANSAHGTSNKMHFQLEFIEAREKISH